MREEGRKLSDQKAMKKVELMKVVFLLLCTPRCTGIKSTK